MNDYPTARMLSLCPDPQQSEKDLRRAHAILQTRKLKREYAEGKLPRARYLQHLSELSHFITTGAEPLTVAKSGQRLKAVDIDTILVDYLMGGDGTGEMKRALGSW